MTICNFINPQLNQPVQTLGCVRQQPATNFNNTSIFNNFTTNNNYTTNNIFNTTNNYVSIKNNLTVNNYYEAQKSGLRTIQPGFQQRIGQFFGGCKPKQPVIPQKQGCGCAKQPVLQKQGYGYLGRGKSYESYMDYWLNWPGKPVR